MLKTAQKGFTLIELMIVVAIIGILAAIAIPAYQDYTVRTQVTEGLNLAAEVKTAVADFWANRGRLPPNNTSIGGAAATSYSGNYVQSITVGTGQIDVVYGNKVNAKISGSTLTLRAGTNGAGQLVWLCGRAPAQLNTTANGTDSTNIDNRFLPSDCRP